MRIANLSYAQAAMNPHMKEDRWLFESPLGKNT